MLDTNLINEIVGVGVPAAGTLALLTGAGWRRRRREAGAAVAEQARQQLEDQCQITLPDGAAYTFTEREAVQLRQDLVGFYKIVAVGTYGLNQAARLLNLLALCKLGNMVGSILAVENDAQIRSNFRNSIPREFDDRIIEAYSESFGGGNGNRPPDWVLDHIHLWGGTIHKATEQAVYLQKAGTNGKRGRVPGCILLFLSLGGHPANGLPVMDVLSDKFEEVVTIGFTALPDDEQLRENFSLLKKPYEQRGVVGWIIQDNLEADPVTLDTGMVNMLVGLAEAALHADNTIQPNNVFIRALGNKPGNVLSYRMYTDDVVSYPFPAHPQERPRYYVYHQQVVESISKGLAAIVAGKGLVSLSLPVGEPKTSTFDIVTTNLAPDALLEVKDDVVRNLRVAAKYHAARNRGKQPAGTGMLFGKKNYSLIFSGLTTVIDPEKPVCQVMVLRLQAIKNGSRMTNAIVTVPAERAISTLQQVETVASTAPQHNGQKPKTLVS